MSGKTAATFHAHVQDDASTIAIAHDPRVSMMLHVSGRWPSFHSESRHRSPSSSSKPISKQARTAQDLDGWNPFDPRKLENSRLKPRILIFTYPGIPTYLSSPHISNLSTSNHTSSLCGSLSVMTRRLPLCMSPTTSRTASGSSTRARTTPSSSACPLEAAPLPCISYSRRSTSEERFVMAV